MPHNQPTLRRFKAIDAAQSRPRSNTARPVNTRAQTQNLFSISTIQTRLLYTVRHSTTLAAHMYTRNDGPWMPTPPRALLKITSHKHDHGHHVTV